MSFKAKTKLTPNYNWKSILLEDISGTGITGYGANQDPVGERQASAINKDIKQTNIYVTSPDAVETLFELNATAAFNMLSTPKTILNTDLGLLTDETITDGIWKVEYIPYFNYPNPTNLTYNLADNTLVFDVADKLYFKNNTRLLLVDEFAISFNVLIININFTTGVITFTGDDLTEIGSIDRVWQGIGVTNYTVFAKKIKECLDNKVADITNCECEDVDCELVNKYLLYDAMFVNCKEGNATKAQQIFDLLTTYCGHNCGC
jgi:hypothetical protein